MRKLAELRHILEVFVGHKNYSSLPEKALQQATELQRDGKSVMAVVTDTNYSGLIAVADPVREESQKCASQTERNRYTSYRHVTGDHPRNG